MEAADKTKMTIVSPKSDGIGIHDVNLESIEDIKSESTLIRWFMFQDLIQKGERI